MEALLELRLVGLPLSFIVTSMESQIYMGCVVGSGSRASLVPVREVGRLVEAGVTGFPYFHLDIVTDPHLRLLLYETLPNQPMALYHSVLSYGHLLPHLASLEVENREDPIPYAVVTTNAYHMNEKDDFV